MHMHRILGQTGRLPSTADDTGLDEDLDLNVGPDSSVSAEDSSSVLTDLEQSDLELPSIESLNDQSELSSEVSVYGFVPRYMYDKMCVVVVYDVLSDPHVYNKNNWRF